MMNTINNSTCFTPFQLCMGQSPQVIPPLVPAKSSATMADINAWNIICCLETDIMDAQDNLLRAKIVQLVQANKHCMLTFHFKIGSHGLHVFGITFPQTHHIHMLSTTSLFTLPSSSSLPSLCVPHHRFLESYTWYTSVCMLSLFSDLV